MEVKITPLKASALYCSIIWPLLPLWRQFPASSWSPAPATQALPVLPTHQDHSTSGCALDGPSPLPGMCFSQSPWSSLPNALGLLLSGRSSLTTQSLSCFIFFHSIYHHRKHLWISLLYIHTHMHGSLRARTLSIFFTATSQHLKPVSTELWACKYFLINKSMKWRKKILGCKIV